MTSDERVELLARMLCEEMGEDPDEIIEVEPEQVIVRGVIQDVWFGGSVITAARWQTYRAEADRIFAQRRALARFDDAIDERIQEAMARSGASPGIVEAPAAGATGA